MFKKQKTVIITAVLTNLLLFTATMQLFAQNGSDNDTLSDSNMNQMSDSQSSNQEEAQGQSFGLGTIQSPCILAPVGGSSDQMQGQSNDNNQMSRSSANQTQEQNEDMTAAGENDDSSQGLCADYLFGTDRQNARWPVPGYVQIEPKQAHWYRFRYNPQIDTTDTDTGNDQPAETVIQMRTSTPGCAGFDVQTRDRLTLQQSLRPEELDPSVRGPVGRGSPAFRNTDDQGNAKSDDSNLIWVGRSGASDNYYVIVRNNSSNSCSYLLTIKGSGVNF